MTKRIRDARIRNARPTRQERLIRIVVSSDKTFEEAFREAVDKVKIRRDEKP